MVNELIASPTVQGFASLAALTGYRRGAVSAATEGSNARFWWLTLFTLRDDHVATTSRRSAARYASGLRPALFFGVSLPFLCAQNKEMG